MHDQRATIEARRATIEKPLSHIAFRRSPASRGAGVEGVRFSLVPVCPLRCGSVAAFELLAAAARA